MQNTRSAKEDEATRDRMSINKSLGRDLLILSSYRLDLPHCLCQSLNEFIVSLHVPLILFLSRDFIETMISFG
ncbi:hypothetical protein L6452_21303 [Arctium lappa]|uniref:Uncharacterized protein n=1 Tax=Arctium lappa TaxID=4217 RepID=A0ACB9BE98_ARCLA|nr:hypothetical protein L6452_21303 [Arctium lappa]